MSLKDESVLRIEKVEKYFGDLQVLKDISLEIKLHEIVTVLGPSGCGKTTLLRILNGLIPYECGEVRFKERLVTKPSTSMAVVFQNFGLFPWKRLSQNIGYGLKIQRRAKQEINEIVEHYTDLVGLNGFENHYPGQLSGGMQQRAGLARALATQPQILLMDEPFGALDALTREQLQEELLRINKLEPKTMLFITHSIDEALLLGDRVIVMSPRPGSIRHEFQTNFGKNRDIEFLRGTDEFQEMRHFLWDLLKDPDVKVEDFKH